MVKQPRYWQTQQSAAAGILVWLQAQPGPVDTVSVWEHCRKRHSFLSVAQVEDSLRILTALDLVLLRFDDGRTFWTARKDG